MQIYAIQLQYVARYGKKNNSLVFDLTEDEKSQISSGQLTLDAVYEQFKKDPIKRIAETKERGIERLIGIRGSNGSGKSSILESIPCMIYDKFPRKNVHTDKADQSAGLSIITKINGKYPKDLQTSYMEMYFEEGGKIYRLKRGRNFTGKQQKNQTPFVEFECLNGQKEDSLAGHRSGEVTQTAEQIIGVDYTIFLNSIFFTQKDLGGFLLATDKVKKDMLIKLLNLEDVVSGCLELIRSKQNAKSKEVIALESKINTLNSSIAQKLTIPVIEDNITQLLNEIDNIEKQIHDNNLKIEDLSKSQVLINVDQLKKEKDAINNRLSKIIDEVNGKVNEWKLLLSGCESDISSNNTSLTQNKQKISNGEKNIESLNQKIKSFDKKINDEELQKVQQAKAAKPKREEQLNDLNKQLNVIVEDIGKLKGELSPIEKELNKTKLQLSNAVNDRFECSECKSIVPKKHIEDRYSDLINKKKNIDAEISKLSTKQNEINANIDDIKKKLKNIEIWVQKEAEIIGKEKDYNRNIEVLKDATVTIKELNDNVNVLVNKNSQLEIKKKDYSIKIEEIKKHYDSELVAEKNKLSDCDKKLNDLSSEISKVQSEIDNIKNINQSLRNKQTSSNKLIGSYKQDITTIKDLQTKVSESSVALEELKLMVKRLSILDGIMGLDGVQNRIISKYLPLLNVYINEFLEVLTCGQTTAKLYINDGGKIDIDIFGATSDDYVMLSGAEKDLIKMSVNISLALLSFTRNNHKPDLLILDEIWDSFDPEKVECVFRLLNKLRDKFTRIIMISHDERINSRIPNHVIIQKDLYNDGLSEIVKIT